MNPVKMLRQSDLSAGTLLVDRLRKLQQERVTQDAAGCPRAAVRASELILDQLEGAASPQLQAALMVATTPELQTLPVSVVPPQVPDISDVLEAVIAYGATCEDYARRSVTSDRVQDALQDVREMLQSIAMTAAVVTTVEQIARTS